MKHPAINIFLEDLKDILDSESKLLKENEELKDSVRYNLQEINNLEREIRELKKDEKTTLIEDFREAIEDLKNTSDNDELKKRIEGLVEFLTRYPREFTALRAIAAMQIACMN